MEARMGAFMIHHSEELIVSQHLGQGTVGENEGACTQPERVSPPPTVPALPWSPLKTTGPKAVTPQPLLIPPRGSALSVGSQEEGAGWQLTHNPQSGS